jgi:hypothetical protein
LFSAAFRLACARRYQRFLAELSAPERPQGRLLADLVEATSRTRYGQSYGVAAGDSYADFARKLPIVEYDDIEPWIRRQQDSRAPMICPEAPAFWERTSGSSGAAKMIPYTRGLQNSFVRMFLLWAYDCLQHGPRLSSGCTFLSVSPTFPDQGTLPDDSEYLPAPLRWLVGRYLVLPRGLRQVTDPMLFKRVLAAHLLSQPRLEVISVWNPTYFSSLLDFIDADRSRVVADLAAGEIDAGRQRFRFRAMTLPRGALDYSRIWPQLRLLSCWTDGNAAMVLEPLRRRLPHAVVQGKGLIATEAPMTIPLWRAAAPVPLLGDVFFEFASDDGEVRRLHELEEGRQYDLIISQRGGLVRYRIGDRVETSARFQATPTLRFVGRSRQVSDLVGEKLNESFVRDALKSVTPLSRARWMLAPTLAAGRARYVCLVEGASSLADLAGRVDRALQQAHHYRLARQLEQLAPATVERHACLDELYLRWNALQGRRLGNIKPCVLIADVERAESFVRFLHAAGRSE